MAAGGVAMVFVVRDAAGNALVSVAGRFDAHEVAAVRPVLRDVIAATAAGASVWVDLSGAVFFDARALRELLEARATGSVQDVAVRVAGPSGPVRSVLTLAGVTPNLVAA